jgi:hypothetical protein
MQRKQSARIWNKIGASICSFYRYEKSPKIQFEKADEDFDNKPVPK